MFARVRFTPFFRSFNFRKIFWRGDWDVSHPVSVHTLLVNKKDSVKLKTPLLIFLSFIFFFFSCLSCFCTLRSFRIFLLTSKLQSGWERDKEVCRKKGIGDFSLRSFSLYCFPVRGIKEFTHNCTPYAKWGVVIPESSLERYLPWQSSPHIWSRKKLVSLCLVCTPTRG